MNTNFDLSKPIAIGGDHAGFEYKAAIIKHLNGMGYQVSDMGTYSAASVDYPDYAHPTAASVEMGEAAFGILICGAANGVAITANKHQGIRASICWQKDIAEITRLHNNSNVLCIPARFISLHYALEIIETFMNTRFEGGRHATRVDKIACS
jgi:ribose 5-phosphate isomerase B